MIFEICKHYPRCDVVLKPTIYQAFCKVRVQGKRGSTEAPGSEENVGGGEEGTDESESNSERN